MKDTHRLGDLLYYFNTKLFNLKSENPFVIFLQETQTGLITSELDLCQVFFIFVFLDKIIAVILTKTMTKQKITTKEIFLFFVAMSIIIDSTTIMPTVTYVRLATFIVDCIIRDFSQQKKKTEEKNFIPFEGNLIYMEQVQNKMDHDKS